MVDPDPALLVGHWVHVYEEDDAETRVFCRAGTPLPPSRGRTEVTVDPNLNVTRATPGPDDRPTDAQPVRIGFGPRPPGVAAGNYLKVVGIDGDRLRIAKAE